MDNLFPIVSSPQSIGLAERAVGILKKVMVKCSSNKLKFEEILLRNLATPIGYIVLAQELCMGHSIRLFIYSWVTALVPSKIKHVLRFCLGTKMQHHSSGRSQSKSAVKSRISTWPRHLWGGNVIWLEIIWCRNFALHILCHHCSSQAGFAFNILHLCKTTVHFQPLHLL